MLKPYRTTSSAAIVWHMDPAIDKERSDLDAYLKNVRDDPSCWNEYLKFKDGQHPTKFVIGVIDPSDLNRIEDEAGYGTDHFHGQTMRWLCFMHGLRSIENSESIGKPDTITKFNIEYVDPMWTARTFVGPLRACGLFIGGIAWHWNNLGVDDAKNS